MVNIEYLEQLINSIEKALIGYENASNARKEKVKEFIFTISREINKILTQK